MVEYMLGDPVAEVPPAERREKSVRKTPKVGDKEILPSEKALWYGGEGCTRQSIAWHTVFNLEISSKAEAFSAFLSQRRFSFAPFLQLQEEKEREKENGKSPQYRKLL